MCTSNSYLVHSGLHPRGGTNNSGFDDPAWQRAQFSLLVAAASHDIGHIGVSNAYLKAVGHPLSVEYADTVGILEAMHASTALAIFRQPGKNILECMSEGNGNQMREQIVELILVTDLSKQAGFLQEWMDRRTESVSVSLSNLSLRFSLSLSLTHVSISLGFSLHRLGSTWRACLMRRRSGT